MTLHQAPPQASIVIVTRNRLTILLDAVRSALAQHPAVPVIVIDDASEDATASVLPQLFPQVGYHRLPQPTGCPGARNAGMALAKTPIVVFIDDDAAFENASTVATTVACFTDPRIAAVAIPYVENGRSFQTAPDADHTWLTSQYYGVAHALRREQILALGGYREALQFYVEEADLCMRLLHKGFLTRLGCGAPVRHSPHRDRLNRAGEHSRAHRFQQLIRNETLFKWWHTPWPYLPFVLLHHLLWACFRRGGGSPAEGLRAIAAAVRFLKLNPIKRAPVSLRTYHLWRRLSGGKAVPLEQLNSRDRD